MQLYPVNPARFPFPVIFLHGTHKSSSPHLSHTKDTSFCEVSHLEETLPTPTQDPSDCCP